MILISSGPFASTHCPPVSSRIGRSSTCLPVIALTKIKLKLASGWNAGGGSLAVNLSCA